MKGARLIAAAFVVLAGVGLTPTLAQQPAGLLGQIGVGVCALAVGQLHRGVQLGQRPVVVDVVT